MPVLKDYKQFGHTHWQTGTLASVLTYAMDAPISEALLFGTSGGIVAGYHSTDAKQPLINILTRTPFTPIDTIIERLKLPTDDRRTSRSDRAFAYLLEAITEGHPVIVWLDGASLPYTLTLSADPVIQPVVVYGYDRGDVYLSDRAQVPLILSADEFEHARDRANSERYRQMTVGEPHPSRLPLAVRLGIESCLRDFLEEPPMKDLRGKFGLAAYEHWAHMLESKTESGWRSRYPRGRKLLSVLVSAYRSINFEGTGGNGSRAMFADFLDEAADMLDKPTLKATAAMWREQLSLWDKLNDALLPPDVTPFAQLRDLMQRQYQHFIDCGLDAKSEQQQWQAQLGALQTEMGRKFPLSKREVGDLFDNLRDAVLAIHEAESATVHDLKAVMLAVGV